MELTAKCTQPSSQNFGMALDMNSRKIVKKFCPKGGIEAEKLMEEVEAAKLILQERTKDVHVIIIPAEDYDGTPRLDIGIQPLTQIRAKTKDPIINLSNWFLRRYEIKHKTPRVVEYSYPQSTNDFAAAIINKVNGLIDKFLGRNKPKTQAQTQILN